MLKFMSKIIMMLVFLFLKEIVAIDGLLLVVGYHEHFDY